MLFALALAANVATLVGNLERPRTPGVQPAGLDDFRDATYYPTRDFLEGGNPYDVSAYFDRQPVGQEFNLYAPAHLLVHAPLAMLPYRLAELTYFTLSVALMVVLARVVLGLVGARPSAVAVLLVASALLLSMPGRAGIEKGQPVVFVVLGVYLALRVGDRRPWLAGIGLAVALLKPQFGIPLAVLLLARGDRRTAVAGTGIVAGASLAVVPWLVAASGGVSNLVSTLVDNYEFTKESPYTTLDSPVAYRSDTAGVFARLHDSLTGPWTEPVLFVVLMFVAVMALRPWRRDHWSLDAHSHQLAVGVICLATLVSIFHGRYDFLLLAWPLAAVVAGFGGWWKDRAPRLRWALLALLAAPAFYSAQALDTLFGFTDLNSQGVPLGVAATVAFGIYAWLAFRVEPQPVGPSSTTARADVTATAVRGGSTRRVDGI